MAQSKGVLFWDCSLKFVWQRLLRKKKKKKKKKKTHFPKLSGSEVAPAWIKSWTACKCPSFAASNNAVSPLVVVLFKSIPFFPTFFSNSVNAWVLFVAAALMKKIELNQKMKKKKRKGNEQINK